MLKVNKNNRLIRFILLISILTGIILVNPEPLISDSNQEASKITRQINLAKYGIEDHILENNYKVYGQNKVSFENEIKIAMDEGRLFDSMGIIKDDHLRISKNTYFKLDNEYINSQIDIPLSGLFISTNNGDILYIQKQ